MGRFGAIRPAIVARQRCFRNALSIRDLLMPSTFDTVANIISETCDIPRETIKPESHAINDLGIDSLDFLDIAFAIDKAFGSKATTEQYFQLNNLCTRIDELVAAKGA
jgi:acyl carrier protein